jgi:hypothetical protein
VIQGMDFGMGVFYLVSIESVRTVWAEPASKKLKTRSILEGQKSESSFLFSAALFPKEHCVFEDSQASPFVLVTATCS